MSKKVSYQNLLKQAIAEYDTSKSVEVKGPMLDPILSYDGGGELPTYKDAASILERYYFNEDRDEGVELMDEADYENDKGEDGKGMDHEEGTGTEQAGTSDKKTIPASKKEKEKDIAKEQEEMKDDDEDEAEEEKEEAEMSGKNVPKAKKYVDEQEKEDEEDDEEDEEEDEEDEKEDEEDEKEDEEVTEDLENQVIEKLISEMEEEDEAEEEDEEEEMEEMKMTYTGDEPAVSNPKEKKSTDSEEHATGAGTEQAGTGDAEGEVPDRKDMHDKMVKAKNYNEQEEKNDGEKDDEEKDDEEKDEELDVDKKMKEATPLKVIAQKQKDYDTDTDAVSEAFELFKELIEDEDE